MESPWLWIIPCATVLYEVVALGKERRPCLCHCAVKGFILGVVFTVIGFVGVKVFCGGSRVSKSSGWVEWRGNSTVCWVVVDDGVLGGSNYPRVLRGSAAEQELLTFRFVGDASKLPDEAELIVFCGKSSTCGRRGKQRTIWLSPSVGAPVVTGDAVIVGEFSSVVGHWKSGNAVEVLGVADFIPDWPSKLSFVANRY